MDPTFAENSAAAVDCPFCGVDLERHIVGLDGQVFVCEICMHEVPGPVPNQRRSGGSPRLGPAPAVSTG